MLLESTKIQELVVDDRDNDDSILVVPDNLNECIELESLTLLIHYDKNYDKYIDFFNTHPIIPQLKTLDFYYLSGMHLDKLDNVSVMSIKGSNSRTGEFPNLSGMANLEKLKIWYSPEGSIEDLYSFCKQLNELKKLKYLEWNNFEYDDMNCLEHVKNIEELKIYLGGKDRELNLINVKELPRLKSLKVEAFSGINIIIPDDYVPSNTLDVLNLEKTHLATIENQKIISKVFPKTKVDLGSRINNFYKQFEQDTNELASFELEYLNLTEIPEEIVKYKKIKSLKVDGKINTETFERINPDCIEELALNCFLDVIPTVVSKMSNLKSLSLGGFYGTTNMLVEIPDWIGDLKNLETLQIVGNRVSKISDNIQYCKNLKNLYMHYDDGDRVHSNAICRNKYAIDNLIKCLPETNIVFD
jgi:Leucine-rich repeat (LRR) protein